MSFVVSRTDRYENYIPAEYKSKLRARKSHELSPLNENDSEFDDLLDHKSKKTLGVIEYIKQKKQTERREKVHYIKDIMTKRLVIIEASASVIEAINSMIKWDIHHLPVMINDYCVGIISDRDIFPLQKDPNISSIKVESIMSKDVILCRDNAPIREAARVMTEERISSLPVLNEENELIGIVSSTDLLKAIVNRMPLELWT